MRNERELMKRDVSELRLANTNLRRELDELKVESERKLVNSFLWQ